MQLVEEYLQRHAIKKKIPKHIESYGVFFLKSCENWHIVKIEYEGKPRPGQYLITSLIPRVNSSHYMDNYSFLGCTTEVGRHYINWSEYWDYFYRWTKNVSTDRRSLKPIGLDKEVVLGIWEIFVYQNMATFIESAYDDNFCASLDVSQSLLNRHRCYQNYLMAMNTPVNHGFLSTITGWTQLVKKKYCPWIYDLIKDAELSKT